MSGNKHAPAGTSGAGRRGASTGETTSARKYTTLPHKIPTLSDYARAYRPCACGRGPGGPGICFDCRRWARIGRHLAQAQELLREVVA